jgi:hypothetical protein
MTDLPYAVPPGWKLVPESGRLSHTVAFRVTAEEHVQLLALRDTMPNRTWGEAIRWVLGQPVVQELVSLRLEASQSD